VWFSGAESLLESYVMTAIHCQRIEAALRKAKPGTGEPVGLSAVGEQANLLTSEEPLAPSVWRKRGFVPTPVWSAHVAA
jgi:hypothetical protein